MLKSLKWALVGMMLSATVVAQQQVLITGRALNVDRGPLANATIRLRNLLTRQIDQVQISNAKGEFSFIAKPEIPYVAEIADPSGRTAAVSDVVTPHAGDSAATIVALPAKLPATGGIFSDTAGSVMSAATGAGVTVLQTGILPVVSPER